MIDFRRSIFIDSKQNNGAFIYKKWSNIVPVIPNKRSMYT